MTLLKKSFIPLVAIALVAMAPGAADAQGRGGGGGGPGGGGGNGGNGGGSTVDGYYSWMHTDVALAFDETQLGGSFTGVGSHLIVIDSFYGTPLSGNLDGTSQSQSHGAWTTLQASLVAPGAALASDGVLMAGVDYNENVLFDVTRYYSATGTDLNVVNLSFALAEPVGGTVNLGALGNSIITQAKAGSAVFVKAAGNSNGGAVDESFAAIIGGSILTVYDELNLGLIDTPSTLFVGALSKDGGTKKQASMARYSTIAGDDPLVQANFLVVGVKSGENGGLEGTSFAAPIVSGYAAILGDKFEAASPTQVVDQLLATAREDTIRNYDVSVHGQGEACLACALSAISIPK